MWPTGTIRTAGAALLLVPTAAAAQDARVDQTQLGSAPGRAPTVQQISEPGRRIATPIGARLTDPVPQVSVPGTFRQAMPQVTSERRGAAAPAQLSRGGTAEASAALSRPSDGRSGAVAPIGGHDRCDRASGQARARDCPNVIENRSAEFARPNPLTLSPEQRLLVDQRLREANTVSPRTPVIRPGDVTEADPDAPQGQVVASIVRDQVRPDDAKSPVGTLPTDDPAGVAAVIDAIVGNGGGQIAPR